MTGSHEVSASSFGIRQLVTIAHHLVGNTVCGAFARRMRQRLSAILDNSDDARRKTSRRYRNNSILVDKENGILVCLVDFLILQGTFFNICLQ